MRIGRMGHIGYIGGSAASNSKVSPLLAVSMQSSEEGTSSAMEDRLITQ